MLSHTMPILSEDVHCSLGFWHAALLLKKVHRIWQFSGRVQSYSNPDNFLGLGVGYALNFALGQNRLLKLPALPFLIGARLLDLFEQEDALHRASRRWKEAVKSVQPITVIAPLGYWQLKARRLIIRVQRIAVSTLQVAKEGFKLIMRIMDVLELVTFDPHRLQGQIDLSVQEGALNIPRCLHALNRNKIVLLKRLEGKREIIDRLLKRMGAKKASADTVIGIAKSGIENLHGWVKSYEAVAQGVKTVVASLMGGPKQPVKRRIVYPPDSVITMPDGVGPPAVPHCLMARNM
jgi:hypothetical protein